MQLDFFGNNCMKEESAEYAVGFSWKQLHERGKCGICSWIFLETTARKRKVRNMQLDFMGNNCMKAESAECAVGFSWKQLHERGKCRMCSWIFLEASRKTNMSFKMFKSRIISCFHSAFVVKCIRFFMAIFKQNISSIYNERSDLLWKTNGYVVPYLHFYFTAV